MLIFAVIGLAMQTLLHPAFTPSEPKLRTAFTNYEQLARNRSRQYAFGEAKSVQVPIEGHDSLQLSIVFLPPLEEAKKRGFDFGKVRGRTSGDRREQIDPLVQRVRDNKANARFEVILKIPDAVRQDENAVLPSIGFTLLSEDGVKLDPVTPPQFAIPSPRDIFPDQIHVVQFPVRDNVTRKPIFTNAMNKITLSVKIGEIEQKLEFSLGQGT